MRSTVMGGRWRTVSALVLALGTVAGAADATRGFWRTPAGGDFIGELYLQPDSGFEWHSFQTLSRDGRGAGMYQAMSGGYIVTSDTLKLSWDKARNRELRGDTLMLPVELGAGSASWGYQVRAGSPETLAIAGSIAGSDLPSGLVLVRMGDSAAFQTPDYIGLSASAIRARPAARGAVGPEAWLYRGNWFWKSGRGWLGADGRARPAPPAD